MIKKYVGGLLIDLTMGLNQTKNTFYLNTNARKLWSKGGPMGSNP